MIKIIDVNHTSMCLINHYLNYFCGEIRWINCKFGNFVKGFLWNLNCKVIMYYKILMQKKKKININYYINLWISMMDHRLLDIHLHTRLIWHFMKLYQHCSRIYVYLVIPVCFLCFNLNLIWLVPDTLHLTWTNWTS